MACAWWRRPTKIDPVSSAIEPEWSAHEARVGWHGLMSVLPWLNHPDDIRRAEHKPLQLAHAAAVGLTVPPTLLTNRPDEVRTFAKEHGPLIYKPFAPAGLSDHRLTPDDGDEQLWLFAPDGSWSVVDLAKNTVEQYGPRHLWDEVERAYQQWDDAGRPARERVSLTVTRDATIGSQSARSAPTPAGTG